MLIILHLSWKRKGVLWLVTPRIWYYKRLNLISCFIKYSPPVCLRGWWTPLLFTAGIASAKFFIQHVSRQNTLTQARRNISRHYDLVWDGWTGNNSKNSVFLVANIMLKHLFLCCFGFFSKVFLRVMEGKENRPRLLARLNGKTV